MRRVTRPRGPSACRRGTRHKTLVRDIGAHHAGRIDIPRPRTRALAVRRFWWRIAPFAFVTLVTFGVVVLISLGMYVARLHLVPEQRTVASSPWRPIPPPESRPVIFRSVSVVDVDAGAVLPPQDVVTSEGRIVAMGTGLEAPRHATRIDGAGKYLLPGLIDTHVHVTAEDQLFLFLAAGVTTVQGLGGPLAQHQSIVERIMKGEVTAPEYVRCDYVVRGSAGLDVDRAVDEATRAGVECIKIYSPPDWTPDAFAALIRSATGRGLRIGGHLPRNLPLDQGLGHGQQFVAHAEEYLYAFFNKRPGGRSDADIPHAVTLSKAAAVIISPTLVAYRAIVNQTAPDMTKLLAKPELRHVRREVRSQWFPPNNRYRQRFSAADSLALADAFAFQQRLVAAWHAGGVPLAIGTDASPAMPFVIPGFSAIDELQELEACGLSPADALRAATITGARLLGREHDIGRIAVGYRADLLLLNANPLETAAHAARRARVMARGRWMPERWLREHMPAYP